MKILVVGNFSHQIHEPAISNGFRALGHSVEEFKTNEYFKTQNVFIQKYFNFQIKNSIGPTIYSVNKDLKKIISSNTYNFIFFLRPIFFNKNILNNIKENTKVLVYNNDDPFGLSYSKNIWKSFFRFLPAADHIFYYRPKNKIDYSNIGYSNTSLLRSYFIDKLNFKIDIKVKKYDVLFVGHYENDGRDEVFKKIIENGIKLGLFGPEWHRSKHYTFFKKTIGDIVPLNEDYNYTLNNTKIALVFLSKLNNDTYTRRCFEIPAAGTFMLSEYTDDMASMFIPDKEAVYFANFQMLSDKIDYYLINEEEREQISLNGYLKVHEAKHEVTDRAQQIIDTYNLL